ncbi:MAG: response regulator transcription factor [Pseudomonadota bacterium]
MSARLLLIEDDAEMRLYLAKALVEAGYAVETAAGGRDGLAMGLATGAAGAHDAIILDRMLPDLDGLSVLKSLRAAEIAAPILLLTAMSAVDERVSGLRAGADDYLVKPFALAELLARLEALLRRPAATENANASETRLACGDLQLDLVARAARRDGAEIELQRMEFLLLEYLMRRAGQVVTRSMLLEGVWGYRFDPKTNVIDVHVSRLRKKIDPPGGGSMIQTVRGVGYRLGPVGAPAPGSLE